MIQTQPPQQAQKKASKPSWPEQPNISLKFLLGGLATALLFFVLDQASKFMIRDLVLSQGGHIEILPFFNLVYVWNYGISFGLMKTETSFGVFLLIAVTSMITGLFAVLLWRSENWLTALSCGLIIGGAIGNIVDRILYGAVYDFLDFHLYGYHWPAFNVADSCVVVGIALMAFELLVLEERRKGNKNINK